MPATRWQQFMDENRAAHDAALFEFLRIPSVSTDPAQRAAVRQAAEWTAKALRQAGVPVVELWESPGHPAVFGEWRVAADQPTVLIYGHYDVQPVEPLELWNSPPFEPTVVEERIYARGSADMKANLATLIQAVEALARTNGAPPVNLIFLLEGEEEIGSPNLPGLVRTNRDRLQADVALSADGGMFGPDQPSIVAGLKGITGCQVDVVTSSTDLHSGSYGAAVPNAVQVMSQLATSFHDANGKVAVAGFYDDVIELTPQEREEIAGVPFDESGYLAESGATGLWGEPGYSVVERRWTRPTVDFNGIWGGFQGDGTKTVTPSKAHLKITSRLVPGQEPETILELIEQHVMKHAPVYAEVAVQRMPGSARPFRLDRANPAVNAAMNVLQDIYGVQPRFVRSGGTVPITEVFSQELDLTTVTIGFAMPGSRAHAPNEWFRLADLPIARRTYARFFEALRGLKF